MIHNNISEFKLYHVIFLIYSFLFYTILNTYLKKKSYFSKHWVIEGLNRRLIEGLRKCIINKNNLYQQTLKKNNYVSYKSIYKKYKNCLLKIINKAEYYYYSHYFITNRNNPIKYGIK